MMISKPRTAVFLRPQTRGKMVRATPGATRVLGRFVRSAVKQAVKGRTATKTKTKIHRKAIPLPNRVGSESTFSITLKPKGLLNKIQGKLQQSSYNVNTDFVETVGAGLQAAESGIARMFGGTHLRSIITNATTQSGMHQGLQTTQVFVKSGWMEYQIQNSSNAVARVQLWDVLARRDAYQDSAGSALSASDAWSLGLKQQTNTGTGNEYKVVGSRPTDSVLFNKYYKVKRVTYIELAPGQVHYHRVKYNINRSINWEVANSISSAIYNIKGWTLSTLLVFYGEPVGDGSGGSTTSPVDLNTICSFNYKFAFLDASAAQSTATNALLTTTTGNLENLVTGATAAYAAVT